MRDKGVSALARRLRVTEKAVRKAIESGRLQASVKHGRIVNEALAIQEWHANRDPAKDFVNGNATTVLTKIREREITARTQRYEIANRVRMGELVPAADVEFRWAQRVVTARTRLLGLPTRAKQSLPHLTVSDLTELDRLVREALEELGGET